jgi:hypothetical protein
LLLCLRGFAYALSLPGMCFLLMAGAQLACFQIFLPLCAFPVPCLGLSLSTVLHITHLTLFIAPSWDVLPDLRNMFCSLPYLQDLEQSWHGEMLQGGLLNE